MTQVAAYSFVDKPFSDEESLAALESYVREWFMRTFKELTPPQRYSFKLIADGHNVIITAPTGSGKTLAGFMSILSKLFKMGEQRQLTESVYCIYVSPLKALDNDVKKNLMQPLIEIREIAAEMGIELPEIKIAVRTSDVAGSEKQRQLKEPPHILITTPESLAILLNAPKFAEKLRTVQWVIVDEIHELAGSKRGAHLSLSLERLREAVGKDFIRIGLGATLHPLEEAARFLVGYDDTGRPRPCKIVDVTWYKPLQLMVKTPVKDIVHASADEINEALYRLLDKLITKHRTTLIFTNTRSGTERVVYNLKERWPDKYNDSTIGAHHGSLSREIRLDIEDRLKRGELKAVVCSTSLELGIDVGYIDLVVQVGSPKSITRAVQRIGRSGHRFGDTARGVIIAMDRDDIVECAVMLKCALERRLDEIKIPTNCLDVLAQHIVGMALTRKWSVDEAFRLVRRSYNYRYLDKETFISLLKYLAGHYAELEDRSVYGKIWFDEKNMMFGKRGKYTRIIYYLNIGTIPDEVKVDVYLLPDKRYIGSIEEEFLERLRPGDIFVLGGRMYRFRYARSMSCYVEKPPKDSLPTIPAWFSELLPLSFELALEIQDFREEFKATLQAGKTKKEIVAWLLRRFPIERHTAEAIYNYYREHYRYTGGKLPGRDEILIETTSDLQERRFIVFHALYGRRVNDALSRAAAILTSDQIGRNVGVIVSDNGFALHIPQDARVDVERLLRELASCDLEELLKRNIRRTEMMKRRFRHCAARSFLILRNYKGYKISVSKQQTNAQTLLNVCEEVNPNFPVIVETYREILRDVMDLERAKLVQEWLRTGRVKSMLIKTEVPTPLAHNLIVLGDADIVLMEDRKKRLLQLHEAVMRKIRLAARS
ncbi:MAG: ATP-dependent helicase [Aigarchaeota archaeon]|nr:ATP-dependent helicase [Candidatus Pelearchaeum maunauluense]